nr:hypothetical protein [Tanacetum cinerariifolium]
VWQRWRSAVMILVKVVKALVWCGGRDDGEGRGGGCMKTAMVVTDEGRGVWWCVGWNGGGGWWDGGDDDGLVVIVSPFGMGLLHNVMDDS